MGRKLTIYNYWTWVPGEGLGQIAPAKRSLADITAVGGLAIFVTGEEVEEESRIAEGALVPEACLKTAGRSGRPPG